MIGDTIAENSFYDRFDTKMLTSLGIFATTTNAEQALSFWQAQIPGPRQISVVVQKRMMLLHMAQYEKLDQVQRSGIIRRAPLDRLAGKLIGVGAVAVPGLGSILAVGPLAPIVANASGGLVNALIRVQMPAGAAQQIYDDLRQGHVLLALHEMSEGPELMSAAQAVRQYHYPLQLVSRPYETRRTGKFENDRERRSMETEL